MADVHFSPQLLLLCLCVLTVVIQAVPTGKVKYVEWSYQEKRSLYLAKEMEIDEASEESDDSPYCGPCKKIMDDIKSKVKDGTKEQYEAAVKKICDDFPAYRAQCESLINENLEKIVTMLMNKVSSEDICKAFHLCAGPPLVQASKESDDSPYCGPCKKIMDDIKSKVKDGTKEQYEAAVKKICDDFPAYRAQCESLINENLEKIVTMLMNKVSSEDICKAFHLCAGPPLVQEPPSTAPFCEMCRDIIHNVEREVKNGTRAQYEDALKRACNNVQQQFRTECNEVINNYLQDIVTMLMNRKDPTAICKKFKLCELPPVVTDMKTEDSPQCQGCKMLVDLVKSEAKDKSKKSYEIALRQACSQVPASLQDECRNIINGNFDKLVEMLIAGESAEKICQEIKPKLCETPPLDTVAEPEQSSKVMCKLCKTIIDGVKKEVKDGTKAQYEEAVKKACVKLIVPKLKKMCETIIDKFLEQIVECLLKKMDTGAICSAIKLCEMPPPVPDPVKGIPCEVCKEVIKTLESMITDRSSRSAIQHALEMVCDRLPGLIQSGCRILVDKYSDELINLLMKELDPSIICEKISLCLDEAIADDIYTQKVTGNIVKADSRISVCQICKMVTSMMENFLQSEHAQEELESILIRACQLLPESLSRQCTSLVKEYGPLFFSLLREELKPDLFCPMIGLCAKSEGLPVQSASVDLGDTLKCNGCEIGTELLQVFLTNNITQDYLLRLSLAFCKRLNPESLAEKCSDSADKYIKGMLAEVKRYLNPDKLCKTMGLCSSPMQATIHQGTELKSEQLSQPLQFEPNLLGAGNPCLHGPSYWCLTLETAQKCQATEYCAALNGSPLN